eukprot:1443350-Pleurochrysis_carterae.AAC.3
MSFSSTSAVDVSARLPAAASLDSDLDRRLVQSLFQCLPPQCRHSPNWADHSRSKVFGRPVRFGSRSFFLCGLSSRLRADGSEPDCAMKALPRVLDSKVLFCSRASSSASTSRMAVTVGARRPVACDIVTLTSRRVPASSLMRRTTWDSFSDMTPSDKR